MQNHIPELVRGSVYCGQCGESRWEHHVAPAECTHPASMSVDHFDNPSRFRCGLCGTRFVDTGDGYAEVAA